MKKIGMLSMALLAILAVNIVAVASASAAACKTEGTAYCLGVVLNSEELLYSLVLVKGALEEGNSKLKTEGLGTLESTGGTIKAHVDEFSTGIEFLEVVITFTGTTLVGAPGCKVSSPGEAAGTVKVKTVVGKYSEGEGGTAGDALFKPETGTEFVTINISGCEQEAILHITGEQLCTVPTPETEAVSHLVTCEFGGSALKDGTKKSEFSAMFSAELESGSLEEGGAEESLTGDAWCILPKKL